MLFQSLSTISSYPNERLLISYNSVNPPLFNSRIGIRFRYFYYGDDEKLNLTNSEYPTASAFIPLNAQSRNYVLSSYTVAGVLLSAKTPTEFLTVNDFTPFRWTVNNRNEFLQYTVRGGLSSITIFPSHPFPIITKISNNVINVSCGLVAASGFNGNVSSYQFKNYVKNNNFRSLSSYTVLSPTANSHRIKTSNSIKNNVVGNNINDLTYFYIPYLASNIYDNSFRIDVPVVTSTKPSDPVYYLSFVSSDFSNKNNDVVTNGYLTLSCLRSEALENAGIQFPYTYDFPYNGFHPVLGVVFVYFRQLLVKKGQNITATFKTSASFVSPSVVSCSNLATNYVQISCNENSSSIFMQDYTLYGADAKDALTISFEPSSRMVQLASSAFRVDTVMTDNYYQNIYQADNNTTLLKRFVETVGDGGLLSKDDNNLWRTSNQWMPFSSTMIMFNANNKANKYQFRIEVGNDNKILRNDSLNSFELLLNKEKAVLSTILTESGSNSATVYVVSLPYSTNTFPSKWDIYPPENVIITTLNDAVVSANEFYPDLFNVKLYNLGVDKTKITFYSSEFETSASTYWFPPSSVSQECTLELKGDVYDNNEQGSITLSALWNRNGLSYRVPYDANVIWSETVNDPRGQLTLKTSSNPSITLLENSVYAGNYDYSILNCSVSTQKVNTNPRNIVFDVNCNVFNSNYNFETNNTFLYRQYPSTDFLSILAATAVNTKPFDSNQTTHVVLKNTATINLSANVPYLIVENSNIFWKITKSDGSPALNYSGATASFSFDSLSARIDITALSAKPFSGSFGYYTFTDYMVFFNLSSINALDYVAFPENKYNPTVKIADAVQNYGVCGKDWNSIAFNQYTQSDGMSSYKPCHTEVFYFSANNGFDKYVWKIGDKLVQTNNNKTTIPLSYSDVSANNTVYLSAYNSVFLEDDPITIYNSASSNNSSTYRQNVNFYDYPNASATIFLDNNVCNSSKYGELPTVTCELNTQKINLAGYTFDVILSSSDFIQKTQYSGQEKTFSKILKIGLVDTDYIISKNSFNNTKVYLSGNVSVVIDGFDFCPEMQEVITNTVDLSVYNGPNLELYTETNYASTGQAITFINSSNKNFFTNPEIKYTRFIFDDGDGNITTTTSSSISAKYITQGAKSPSLTGILSNSAVNIEQWQNFVFIKNDKEVYDQTITRDFDEVVSLPYSLQECKIKANDWQFSSNINSCFEKIKTNLDFLSSCCYINNLNFPKVFAGFLGTKYGNFKWHTNEEEKYIQDDVFYNLKCGQIVDDKLLVINDRNIELYNISQNPIRLYSINRIGDGEILENPVKCRYVNNRLYILDADKKLMLICSFDINDSSSIKLTHYWGGVGAREDKTKLNLPVDFCLDSQNNLFILDKDSYIIKVYNNNLNWIRNIQLSNFSENNKPVNIDCDGENISVLTEDGECSIMDSFGKVTNSLLLKNCTKAFLNHNNYGIIYSCVDNVIKKLTLNTTFVNDQEFSNTIRDIFYDENNSYVLMQNHIYRLVDFIEIDSILLENESLSGFSWDSIYIHENEFVTDYIYNDSFKKMRDNINLLNKRINKKLIIEYNDGKTVSNQYTSSYTPSAISLKNISIGTNEPVLYDTINRSIESLYDNLLELKGNISVGLDYPNINNNIKWIWKYHYIDVLQKPSVFKNAITWSEMNSQQISYNTMLSSASSWCSVRYNLGNNNHSDVCFNFSQTRKGSYIPFTWSDMESSAMKCNFIAPYTWRDFESNCCIKPDFVFEDCKIIC
jgi:hypothetical protein